MKVCDKEHPVTLTLTDDEKGNLSFEGDFQLTHTHGEGVEGISMISKGITPSQQLGMALGDIVVMGPYVAFSAITFFKRGDIKGVKSLMDEIKNLEGQGYTRDEAIKTLDAIICEQIKSSKPESRKSKDSKKKRKGA